MDLSGGCGMVDPNVLKNCNINRKNIPVLRLEWNQKGFAMLNYQIGDIHYVYEMTFVS
jgi:phenylalanyl-tRNA synthetase alpha chain